MEALSRRVNLECSLKELKRLCSLTEGHVPMTLCVPLRAGHSGSHRKDRRSERPSPSQRGLIVPAKPGGHCLCWVQVPAPFPPHGATDRAAEKVRGRRRGGKADGPAEGHSAAVFQPVRSCGYACRLRPRAGLCGSESNSSDKADWRGDRSPTGERGSWTPSCWALTDAV